mgnify:CR=1 FL=1
MESFIIDIRKHFIKKYTLPALREQIKANPAIISLCMDSKGVFWFSQERYGLYVYDAGTDRMGYYLRNGGTKNLPLWEVRNLIPSHVPGMVWAMPYGSVIYGLSQENMEMKDVQKLEDEFSQVEHVKDVLWKSGRDIFFLRGFGKEFVGGYHDRSICISYTDRNA